MGIGLNVNQKLRELPTGATSLYEDSHRQYPLNLLTEEIIQNMRSEYHLLENPAEIIDEWWQNCVHRSRQVQVRTHRGLVKGNSNGVDLDGSLLLQTGKGAPERVIEGTLHITNGKSE